MDQKEYIERIREEKVKQINLAEEAAKKRGYEINPRIKAANLK